MPKWFSEGHKVDIWADPIGGCTAVRYLPYYDMRGYESIDFFVSGAIEGGTVAATAKQNVSAQIYRATNSTGGGATAISSATGTIGKTGTAITTVAKGKGLMIEFTTGLTHAAFGATMTILGQQFVSATGNTAAYYFAGLGSAVSSLVAGGFITAFNNTNCTLSSAWKAEKGQHSTSKTFVYIRPKGETFVGATEYVSAGGSTIFGGIGVPSVGMHLSVKTEQLKDSRYVTLGYAQQGASLVTSTVVVRQPISIFVVRTKGEDRPSVMTGLGVGYSKNLPATAC
jgi:hypothetical protein